MEKKDIVVSRHEAANGSVTSYSTGFMLSIILTLIPFYVVANRIVNGWALVFVLMAFASMQLLVQVVFFLHLGRESKPRWNVKAFLFMLLIIVLLVVGSLWIMHNLHYNMTPHEVEEFIFEEEAIRPSGSRY
jgi:cytochrome o ubiquinol oxidase subunit IV